MLPHDQVYALALDGQGTLWLATGEGPRLSAELVEYDGENWTVHNIHDCGLPISYIASIAIDEEGNKWIGAADGNLARFDGETWQVYDIEDTGLPFAFVGCLDFDGLANTWVGMWGAGLARFDGESWTVYNETNSGLPCEAIRGGLAADGQGNIWVGTERGLAMYNGQGWAVYDTENSGLPFDWILDIEIDERGNKWIATVGGGLAVFREGGVDLPGAGA
jgi:ligand-binding sensor domain-containing protein